MVVTFATCASIACGDAAVDSVTAPKLAAKPATPVAGQFPFVWEVPEGAAVGFEIRASPWFEDLYRTFVVSAYVTFQWANQVSAMVDAWLLNSNGQTVNSGKAGLALSRFGIPVAQGDTTLTVRISTNNITCGLIGKGSYSGSADLMVLDARAVQVKLSGKTINTTTTPDVLQPACPPPPGCEQAPATRVTGATTGVLANTSDCHPGWFPPTEGNEEFYVCFRIWREIWVYDYLSRTFYLDWSSIVGVYCYVTTMM
jgi:hypothetical protein